jgi:hypothetical protein
VVLLHSTEIPHPTSETVKMAKSKPKPVARFVKDVVAPRQDPYVTKIQGQPVGHRVDSKRVDHWLANLNRMFEQGLSIPAPNHHDKNAVPVRMEASESDIKSDNNWGWWSKAFKGADGKLKAVLDVYDEEKAKKIRNGEVNKVSILAPPQFTDGDGQEFKDSITHIALVNHAVIKDQDPFQEVEDGVTAFSPEEQSNFVIFSPDDVESSDKNNHTEDGPVNAASGDRVKTIITLLKKLQQPITLPDDTSSENLAERLITALTTAVGLGENDDNEPPEGSGEQPAPIAMSLNFEDTKKFLAESKALNPATKKPYTDDEIKKMCGVDQPEAQFSPEQVRTLAAANKIMKQGYIDRITTCVKNGQVTPADAKETFEPLLTDENFSVAFSPEGKQLDGPIDTILKAFEKLPSNSALNGTSISQAKKGSKAKSPVLGDLEFSFNDFEIEDPELEFSTDPNEGATDAEADEILKMQGIS